MNFDVIISIGSGFMDVSVNGVSQCDGVRKSRRAFQVLGAQ